MVGFECGSLTSRSVVLVSNRVGWSAVKLISLHWHRWPTETGNQDRKRPLGFNAYRTRSAEAIGNHGCLVFVAYVL